MKFNRIFGLLLASLTLCAATACNGGNGGNGEINTNGKPTPPSNIVLGSDVKEHKVTGTLHKVSVSDSARPFAVNGKSDYVIVSNTSDKVVGTAIKKATDFIKMHVDAATGTVLASASEISQWTEEGKYIVIGNDELFAQAGLVLPEDDIGTTGYYIKTVGNSVFIKAHGAEGYHLGALAFLRAVLGYDMFDEDCVIYEKDGATLPDITIIEKPDIDYVQEANDISNTEQYGMGLMGDTEIYPAFNGATIHNAFEVLPKSEYEAAHPYWYSPDGSQPCMTARGDYAEYDALVETVAQKLIDELDRNPAYENITFTQEDGYTLCKCDECDVYREKYGTVAATSIRFLNDVDDIVQEYISWRYPDKKAFNILFFAYHESEPAPVFKNENGEYQPIDPEGTYVDKNGVEQEWEPMICNPNVNVLLAPISAKFTHSFYEPINAAAAENMVAWKAISSKLYIWAYSTNFGQYLYPYNTWDTMAESYRYFVSQGASYIYNQGQYNQPEQTAFTKLKTYMDSKLRFDCNLNTEEIIDKYFTHYYREAAEPMRRMFNEIQMRMRYIEETYPKEINGYIREEIANEKYWPQELLEGWLTDIDEAYTAVAKYETTDPNVYKMLNEQILQESLFPRYALCTLYASSYSEETLYQMRKSFKDDCYKLNVTRHEEHATIDSVFAGWGV